MNLYEKRNSLSKVPQLEKSQPAFQTHFASLSLHRTDRIRVLQFPDDIIDQLRHVIQQFWAQGIQNERTYSYSHEFKLKGNPWWGQGDDAIPARVLMREVLASLFASGWILTQSTDISKSVDDKDMMVFRRQDSPPPSSYWAAISFNKFDRMRVIGSEGNAEVVPAFKQVLQSMGMLDKESWKDQRNSAYEFKLNGYPWMATGEETMTTRLLVLRMMEALESLGWSLYASIDQNATSNNSSSSETDSWYIVKARDWVPGTPVFHR